MLSFVGWTALGAGIAALYLLVVGSLVNHSLEHRALMSGAGWLTAGLVVAIATPGRRVLEPFLAVLLAWLAVGTGWAALPVAWAGAWLGERCSRA